MAESAADWLRNSDNDVLFVVFDVRLWALRERFDIAKQLRCMALEKAPRNDAQRNFFALPKNWLRRIRKGGYGIAAIR